MKRLTENETRMISAGKISYSPTTTKILSFFNSIKTNFNSKLDLKSLFLGMGIASITGIAIYGVVSYLTPEEEE